MQNFCEKFRKILVGNTSECVLRFLKVLRRDLKRILLFDKHYLNVIEYTKSLKRKCWSKGDTFGLKSKLNNEM